jgi:putative transposase
MSDNAARPFAALSEPARAQAMQRFHLLQLHLKGMMSLAQIAQVHAVPLRTLQHWMRRYRAHGVAGLARKARTDRGQQRKVTPELTHVIEGLALRKPSLSVATIHRQVVTLASQQGWPIPSYRSVCDIVKRLDPALVTLAHDGTKAYREAFDLLHRREADRPNIRSSTPGWASYMPFVR